jgi:hypothetical protein
MATGVISSGGGAGVSAKTSIRGLAQTGRENETRRPAKSSKNSSEFCACQQSGHASIQRRIGPRLLKKLSFKNNALI